MVMRKLKTHIPTFEIFYSLNLRGKKLNEKGYFGHYSYFC